MELTLGAEVQYLGLNGIVVQKKRPNYVYGIKLSTGQIVEASSKELQDPFLRTPKVLELKHKLDKSHKDWLQEAILELLKLKGKEGLRLGEFANILETRQDSIAHAINKLIRKGMIQVLNQDNLFDRKYRSSTDVVST